MRGTVLGLEEQRKQNRPRAPLGALYSPEGRWAINTWLGSPLTPRTFLRSRTSIPVYRDRNQGSHGLGLVRDLTIG